MNRRIVYTAKYGDELVIKEKYEEYLPEPNSGCHLWHRKIRLEFHHIRDWIKGENIQARFPGMTPEEIELELNKGVFLCISCHKRLHRHQAPSHLVTDPDLFYHLRRLCE